MIRYLSIVYLILISFAPGYFQNEFVIIVGNSGIWTSDLLLLYLWMHELVDALRHSKLVISRSYIPFITFGLFVGLYIIISLIEGHSFPSVLRDSRFVLMLILPISMSKIHLIEERHFRIVKILEFLVIVSLVFFYLSLIIGIELNPRIGLDVTYDTKNGVIKHNIGITSTIFWIAIFGIFSFYESRKDNRYVINIIIALLAFFQVFYYSIRVVIWGYLLTIMLIFIVYSKRTKRIEWAFIIVLIMLGISLKEEVWQRAVNLPQTERFISLLDPSFSTSGNSKNRQYRLDAINIALKNTKSLFGSGLGDTDDIVRSQISNNRYENFQAYFNHSAYSFCLYKFGLLGTALIGLNYILLLGGGELRSFFKDQSTRVYLFIFLFLIILGFGTNNFFRGDFLTIQVFLILGLAGGVKSNA